MDPSLLIHPGCHSIFDCFFVVPAHKSQSNDEKFEPIEACAMLILEVAKYYRPWPVQHHSYQHCRNDLHFDPNV